MNMYVVDILVKKIKIWTWLLLVLSITNFIVMLVELLGIYTDVSGIWSFSQSLIIIYVVPSFFAVISDVILIIICVRSLRRVSINVKLLTIFGLINIGSITLYLTVMGGHDDLYTQLTILQLCIILIQYLVSLLVLNRALTEQGTVFKMRTKIVITVGILLLIIILFISISLIDYSLGDIIKYDFVWNNFAG